MHYIAVRLPSPAEAQLQRLADRDDRPLGVMARRLISQRLEQIAQEEGEGRTVRS
jgi:predicted transcriptional regulator